MIARLAHVARRLGRAAVHRPGRLPWAIGAIAAALLAFAVVHLAARNVDAWTSAWTGEASMVVYLDDTVSEQRARALASDLAGAEGIRAVEYVPPAEAARRLRASLAGDDDLLAGIPDDALPASLEVVLAPDLRDVAAVSPIVDRLRAADGVTDVELVGDWVEQVGPVLAALRGAAWALLGLLGALSVWVVAATARLRVASLAAETRVAELLGAPPGFVRWPHLVAGALHGALGGGLAIAGVWLVHRAVEADVAAALTSVMGDVEVAFLPAAQLAALVALGAGLGLLGTLLATGRGARA
jgi:cell division transport system permease protein